MLNLPMGDAASPTPERADAVENRRKILAAARELVREKGACQVSMDDVAQFAGVGKGTLYRRFKDKAALMVALLDDEARCLQEQVMFYFTARPTGPELDKLRWLLSALLSFHLAHATTLEVVSKQGRDRFLAPAHRWQRDLVQSVLLTAVERRECPSMDATYLSEALLMPLDPGLLLHQLRAGLTPERIQSAYLRWSLGGIARPLD